MSFKITREKHVNSLSCTGMTTHTPSVVPKHEIVEQALITPNAVGGLITEGTTNIGASDSGGCFAIDSSTGAVVIQLADDIPKLNYSFVVTKNGYDITIRSPVKDAPGPYFYGTTIEETGMNVITAFEAQTDFVIDSTASPGTVVSVEAIRENVWSVKGVSESSSAFTTVP